MTNETNHNMISTIASFQAERAALVSKDEELREKMSEVRRSADETGMEIKSVQSTLAVKEKLLGERNATIEELEKELCQCKQDAAVANTKLDRAETKLEETHSKLLVSETKYADYQAKTEPIVSQLRQDLTEANGKPLYTTLRRMDGLLCIRRSGSYRGQLWKLFFPKYSTLSSL